MLTKALNRLVHTIRQHRVASGVFLLGVVLVALAGIGKVGADSIALEFGAALSLAPFLVWFDNRLRRIEAQVDQIQSAVVSTAHAKASQAWVQRSETTNRSVFDAFKEEQSLENLQAIVKRLNALHIKPRETTLLLSPETVLRVKIDLGAAFVFIEPGTGVRATGWDPKRNRVVWSGNQTYGQFIHNLGDKLLAAPWRPGRECLARFDVAAMMADQFYAKIQAVANGEPAP